MTTPVAGSTHDITLELNDVVAGFMVRPGSYRVERVDDFAPRIATGNEPSLREGIWDVWAQSGAEEGIDQFLVTNKRKVCRSDGNVFLSRDQRITLESQFASSDASKTATAPMGVDFVSTNNYHVLGINTKARRYNIGADTWTDSTTTFGAACVWLHRHGAYLFAALGTATDFRRSTDADTWTAPSAGEKATCFATWTRNNKVYLVKGSGTSFKLSEDDGVTFDTAHNVGNADTNLTGLGVAFGLLIIGKEDGLYYYDGVSVVEELIFPNKKYTGNCRALVYHDGFLYTSILARVVKLSFSSGGIANQVDITPEMIGDENKELYGHGTPLWLWSAPSGLCVAFDTGESNQAELLTYNGLGWQQAYRATATMNQGSYSRLGARTFINDGSTRIRKHTTLRDLPFPDYAATGVFETSDFDAGLPFWTKAFRDVSIEVENLSGGSVKVDYSDDKGSNWTTIATVTGAGKPVLAFPGGAGVSAKQLRLRFTLARNSSSSTPRLRRFWVAFLNRPNPVYAISATLELAPDQILRDQTIEEESVASRLSFLRSAEASRLPLVLIDRTGYTYLVFVTKTSRIELPERLPDGSGASSIKLDTYVTINMISASIGGVWDEVYWDGLYWS